jgi:hypothetical protein
VNSFEVQGLFANINLRDICPFFYVFRLEAASLAGTCCPTSSFGQISSSTFFGDYDPLSVRRT